MYGDIKMSKQRQSNISGIKATVEESEGLLLAFCLGRTEMDAAMAGRTEKIFPPDGFGSPGCRIGIESLLRLRALGLGGV